MEIFFIQFCTNHSFGIDSYLGRRIRHNTLHGMMLGGVDSIISQFPALVLDAAYMELYERWLEEYKGTIEFLRLELLQFKGENKKRGLFHSQIDQPSPSTSLNVAELRKAIIISDSLDSFEDAVLRFCWDQFEPQLKNAQRFISTELRSREMARIDHLFGQELEGESRRFVAALRASVHDRFATLSSWFQVPEERTLSATIKQISDLITIECELSLERNLPVVDWDGSEADLVIRGSTVHRLYDCLFVVIYNAYKHGKSSGWVNGDIKRLEDGRRHTLEVGITSEFSNMHDRPIQVQRVKDVLGQVQGASSAMIKEGYSGLRKLIYLTSEGQPSHGVSSSYDDRSLRIAFLAAVELEGLFDEGSLG